jgi:hypothetical protein
MRLGNSIGSHDLPAHCRANIELSSAADSNGPKAFHEIGTGFRAKPKATASTICYLASLVYSHPFRNNRSEFVDGI